MAFTRDAFCSFCGTAFPPPLKYPRKCPNAGCGVQIWANPIPVVVVAQPVEHKGRTGLLTIRRAIQPQKDLVSLVGGFLEDHETWQQGGAREVFEETGIRIDPAGLTPMWFSSTDPKPNRVLLFALAKPTTSESLPAFVPSPETSERGLIFGPQGLGEFFAFSLHQLTAERYFESVNISGPHDYITI